MTSLMWTQTAFHLCWEREHVCTCASVCFLKEHKCLRLKSRELTQTIGEEHLLINSDAAFGICLKGIINCKSPKREQRREHTLSTLESLTVAFHRNSFSCRKICFQLDWKAAPWVISVSLFVRLFTVDKAFLPSFLIWSYPQGRTG